MGWREAGRALYAFRFGPPGRDAYRGALLLGAIAISLRPKLPEFILDELDDDG